MKSDMWLFKKFYFWHLLRDKMCPNVLHTFLPHHTVVLCNRTFEHMLSTLATINLSRQVTARCPGTVDKGLDLASPELLFPRERVVYKNLQISPKSRRII